MYYIYVLYALRFNKIYVGYSENPELRLQFRNDPENDGWTKRYQPWTIVYTESFNTKREALIREHQLKTSRGRNFIRSTILTQTKITSKEDTEKYEK